MMTLSTTEKLYSPGKAEMIAAEMQSGDKDWTYKVIHDPKGTGYSFIEVYDEDNCFVGKV